MVLIGQNDGSYSWNPEYDIHTLKAFLFIFRFENKLNLKNMH